MKYLIVCLSLVLSTSIFSQNYNISGVIYGGDESLASATTVVLNKKDSTLVSFALSNNDGQFIVEDLKPKQYILQITYLGYKQWSKPFTIVDTNIDFGRLDLELNAALIDKVEIKGERVPMLVNKDTLQYNADAFQTQPNEVVEDLLKKLPGVEVESDGSITAQGEDVQSVLVDGKKFFGDDPKIATRNLPADAVKTVQIYDKKSDMAEFSGVDDGEREKTINLELKEDRRNGYFGSVEAGYGTDERYKGRLSLNRFNPTTQMSLIGNFNNINEQGFTVGDYVSFMGGFGRRNNSNPVSIFNGLSSGFVTTHAGGFNINHDFSDKTELSFNYFLNSVENDITSNSVRENYLEDDNSFFTNSASTQSSKTDNHRFNLILEHEIDTTQDIKLIGGLTFNNGDLFSNTNSTILSNDILQNATYNDYETDGENLDFSASGIYRKKFGSVKKRIVTLQGAYNNSTNDLLADLESENLLYEDELLVREIILLQDILSDNSEDQYRVGISFVEPLSYGKYLEFEYRRQNFNNDVISEYYDIINNESTLNLDLSNSYFRNYYFDNYSAAFHLNSDKSQFTAEAALQNTHLKGELLLDNVTIKKDVLRVLPRLSWRYDLGQSSNLRVRYSTNVNVPSLEQLQPIVDNSNPLNTYVGNPDLITEYNHQLRMNYFKYDQFTFQSFYAFLNVGYTKNQITNATLVDENFVQSTQPVNVDYNFNSSLNAEFASPIKPLKLRMTVRNRVGYTKGFAYVNGLENGTNRINGNARFTLENRNKDVLDWRFGGSYGYNINKFSEATVNNFNYSSQTLFGEVTYNYKNNFAISTDIDVNFYSAEEFGSAQTVPIWKASLSKYFLKDQRGELKFSVFDILNKNQGVSRTEAYNYIENQEIVSLGQYYMLSFIYALKSNSASSSGPQRGGFRR